MPTTDNRKRLEDTPLSDNEFEQVKLELTNNSDSYNRDFAFAGVMMPTDWT